MRVFLSLMMYCTSENINANTVKIKLTGNYRDDFAAANKLAGIDDLYLTQNKLTWHHHQDLGIMQLVPRKYHNPVSHTGGASLYNQFIEKGLLQGTLYPK